MRLIDADVLTERLNNAIECGRRVDMPTLELEAVLVDVQNAPSIDIVFCENCRKSHIDGKSTHYLWCTEWGRSTDPFGYCERGGREGE